MRDGRQEVQCGRLEDRYGLSGQNVPAVMDEMIQDEDPDRMARVTRAFLEMGKLDIAAPQRAHDGP